MTRNLFLGRMLFAIAALLAMGSVTQAAPPSLTLYVASNGNDAWSGQTGSPNANRTDGPFATLQRARDAIRKRKSAGKVAVTVVVRKGFYVLPQTLRLTAEDSGSAEAPVVYRAAKGEKVILSGGPKISNFVPHAGKVLVADVAAQGLSGVSFRQLFHKGQRQPLARYPDFDAKNPYGGGWAYADGDHVPMYKEIPGEDRRTLHFKPEDAREWKHPEEGEVFVFPRYNWWNNIVGIKSVDRANRKITLAGNCSYPIRPTDRYYIQGLFEDLDAPGEWYLDQSNAKLYYWPPAGVKANRVRVYVPAINTILKLAGTHHVAFRGFTFFCCAKSAVELEDANHCLIASNTIRGVGDYTGSGVAVAGGTHNGVVGNDIFDVGRNAIALSGGDRTTLTMAENYADNNYLHHMGVYHKQGAGVMIRGCGNRASHNLIHDGPRWGIGFWGNKHTVEYNHIRHVSIETADTGGVYTGGRDWLGGRGSVLRYNFLHDILGYGQEHGRWVSPHFAWGIYLDDNTGGVDVIGNIVARCDRGAIHLHNGRDNHVENNVFIDGKLQQIHCSGWLFGGTRWTNHFPEMIQGYESIAGQSAWKSMRNMERHPQDAKLPDGSVMSGNRFLRNIMDYQGNPSQYIKFANLSFDHNKFDHNVVWHHGDPVKTGVQAFGKDVSKNLMAHGGFEQGTPGKMPMGWRMQARPFPDTTAQWVNEAASGKHAIRIAAAFNQAKSRDNYPVVVTPEQKLRQGQSYRLRAKMKATREGAKAKLMLQSFVAGAYFWASSPAETTVGTQWQDVEFTLMTPGPGDPRYHEKMKLFRVRIGFPDQTGSLLVDDVRLTKTESLDQWDSWQKKGMDEHSVVADPLFMDADKDDYRLQPNSPAWEQGFQRLPIDKIGPYQDEFRATWPIVEAEGAREKPLVLTQDTSDH